MGHPESGLRQHCRDCRLEPLPQHPSHGREGCRFITKLFEHPEFDIRDPLDGKLIVEYGDIARLLPGRFPSNSHLTTP